MKRCKDCKWYFVYTNYRHNDKMFRVHCPENRYIKYKYIRPCHNGNQSGDCVNYKRSAWWKFWISSLVLLILLTGCQNQPRQSIIGRRGDIYRYDADDKQISHTRVVLNSDMSFSVGPDGTVSADSRKESFFSWLMKIYTLKAIDD